MARTGHVGLGTLGAGWDTKRMWGEGQRAKLAARGARWEGGVNPPWPGPGPLVRLAGETPLTHRDPHVTVTHRLASVSELGADISARTFLGIATANRPFWAADTTNFKLAPPAITNPRLLDKVVVSGSTTGGGLRRDEIIGRRV